MKRATRILSLFLCLAACTAWAWNDAGHMLISELAWRSLSVKERGAISAVLEEHPHYAELLCAGVPAGVDTNEWVFLKASTWPDMLRPSADPQTPKPGRITRYHRGDWHYVNLPFVASGDLAGLNAAAHPPARTNVIERLGALEDLLRSAREPAEARAVSLCWYLHLVGDIHQPLHSAAWYSPDFPQGDAGGNKVVIKAYGLPIKLHAFWDQALGSDTNHTAIARRADETTADRRLRLAVRAELKADTTYASWADEGLKTAGAGVYLDGRLRYAKYRDNLAAADVPDLNPGYEREARAAARRCAALAGLRLGRKLRELF